MSVASSRLKYARTFPAFEIQITGHTDDTWEGKADHSASSRKKNLDLSLKRAEAVKQFLVDHQIPANKIQAEGRGMPWPVRLTSEADETRLPNATRTTAHDKPTAAWKC
jgi:outer membrane protein OmpA-like peptidoglycan-associated protein